MPNEVLTDEQAAAIWSGGTSSIASLEDTLGNQDDKQKVISASQVVKTSTEVEEDEEDEVVETPEIDEDAITKALKGELEEEDEEEVVEDKKTTPTSSTATKSGAGRKPSDPIRFVSELIEEGALAEFEDGIPKNLEEAKALIKANIEDARQEAVEQAFELKKKSYSPQVQTILDYAEKGVQSASELMELIGAIKDVEDVNDFDITTPEGAEQVVREAYKAKGFKDAYIEKNIKRLKDLDALQEEAEELSPELVSLKAQRVQQKLEAKQKREEQAIQASKVYFKTIEDTLSKDKVGEIALKKEDKYKIYSALRDDSYTSLTGARTNQFVKTLEELQFGQNADYEHFLNVVQFTVDPKGFMDKLKASVKIDTTAETVRRLKTSKTSSANTEVDTNTEVSKRTIKRGSFVNPYK